MTFALDLLVSGKHRFRWKLAAARSIYADLALLAICYVLITVCTGAYFMGDTKEYVAEILKYQRSSHFGFWDFGHLLWRPLGLSVFLLTRPLTNLFAKGNERAQLIVALIATAWISGLVCVLLFFDLTRRITQRNWVAWTVTLAFLFANAFLNYVHAGSSYVPGLALSVAGIWLLAREEVATASAWRVSLPTAFCLAGSVMLWFPYAFVIPAAAMLPWFVYDSKLLARQIIWWTLGQCLAIGLITYIVVILGLGIHNFAGLKAWITSAGHGQMQTRGLIRLAFSFPRSFINLGKHGMYLKRYLVHDPYAPVSLGTLFKLSLWKITAFYVLMAAVCTELFRSRAGRQIVFMLTMALVPTFIFALFIFEAGSVERFLPLYPFIFLAAAYALYGREISRWSTLIILLCFISIAVVDTQAMSNHVLRARRAQFASRFLDLLPRLKPDSVVMTVDVQEDLSEFQMNFPLDPINLRAWRNYNVIEIATARLATWREDFANRALLAWSQGGDVWLSRRFFYARPRAEWNWVEGDDKRIAWTDLPAFFSQFDKGESVGGEDGFVLLANSHRNHQIVSAISDGKPSVGTHLTAPSNFEIIKPIRERVPVGSSG